MSAWPGARDGGLERPHAARLALLALVVLGAANFLWQLGSSSYFVDEVLSIQASTHPLGGVLSAVSHTEITPPAYFYFQHVWLSLAGQSEAWARLPSAVCGALLVAAIYWLALVLCRSRLVALAAGALAALSPFLLEYAQRAQGYMFAMLAVTVAVAAAMQAETAAEARNLGRSQRWLAASALSVAVSLCTNYTAALVVFGLCVWVATRPVFSPRLRGAYVIALAAVQLVLLPLFIVQWHNNPGRHGVGSAAGFDLTHAGRLARAGLEGRVETLEWLALLVLAVALITLVFSWPRLSHRWRLVLAVVIGEPLLVLVLSLFGARVALPRYVAVAVPFMLVAAVMGLALLPRPVTLLGGVALGVVVIAGLVDSHRSTGFYPDTRGAVDYVQAGQRPGDVVLSPATPSLAVPLAYYGLHRLRPLLPYVVPGGAQAMIRQRRRLWVIAVIPRPAPTSAALFGDEQRLARRVGYHVLATRSLKAMSSLAVSLWAPFVRVGAG